MNDKFSSPAYLPREHLFDFKVKVNYENGAVSLIGPNEYSPAHTHPIHFHHAHPLPNIPPHQATPLHNHQPIYNHAPTTSMRNIPFSQEKLIYQNYSSAPFIPDLGK